MQLWIGLILTIALAIMLTLGIVILVRRSRRFPAMRGTTDVEGFYITAIAALYGIVVAFMVFVVWTRYYEALETVEHEATALGDIYQMSAALPPPFAEQMQEACLDYAEYMIDEEWERMASNTMGNRPVREVQRIWALSNAMNQQTVTDSVLRDHITTSIARLTSLRRSRLLQSRTGLPTVLYILLIFGAIITLALASVFATEDFRSHAIKAGALAALIALLLFTVHSLDRPFQGPERVTPEAFERTLDLITPEPVSLEHSPLPDHPDMRSASV